MCFSCAQLWSPYLPLEDTIRLIHDKTTASCSYKCTRKHDRIKSWQSGPGKIWSEGWKSWLGSAHCPPLVWTAQLSFFIFHWTAIFNHGYVLHSPEIQNLVQTKKTGFRQLLSTETTSFNLNSIPHYLLFSALIILFPFPFGISLFRFFPFLDLTILPEEALCTIPALDIFNYLET